MVSWNLSSILSLMVKSSEVSSKHFASRAVYKLSDNFGFQALL